MHTGCGLRAVKVHDHRSQYNAVGGNNRQPGLEQPRTATGVPGRHGIAHMFVCSLQPVLCTLYPVVLSPTAHGLQQLAA